MLWCRPAGLQELRDAVCCSAVQCAGEGLGDGQLESLPHIFLHCPVVQPAVAWLQALWGRVVEDRVPAGGCAGAACW